MGAAIVLIRDETVGQSTGPAFRLELASERVSVRELLRRRVQAEVETYNTAQPECFRGLVQPTDAERVLDGYRLRKRRPLDWNEQHRRACGGFEKNEFFVLLDGRQLESLDEEIVIGPESEARFIKLVPLVGG